MLTFYARILIGSRLPVCLIFSLILHLVLALLCIQKTSFVADGSKHDLARKGSTKSAMLVFVTSDVLLGNETAGVKARTIPANAGRMFTETMPVDQVVELADEITRGQAFQQTDPIVGEPRYFRLSELTRKPLILQEPLLAPPTSTDTEVTGKAILRLFIGKSGAVDRVIVEESELPEAFVESLTTSFEKASFVPGAIEEMAVNSQMRIEVSYETLR